MIISIFRMRSTYPDNIQLREFKTIYYNNLDYSLIYNINLSIYHNTMYSSTLPCTEPVESSRP